jgi:D-alanyl-D-alanine carboxypeptidase/Putative Flp pilus-assembly TadE/G-like
MRQRGGVSLVVATAMGFAGIMASFLADASRVAVGRARAQAAADAAALAAAQELIRSTGRSPADVAQSFAERHGAHLDSCACSDGSSEAVVTISVLVDLPLLGQSRTVRARARAVVAAPPGSEGLQPEFATRLACLFGEVHGLWIVSGYRSHAEQAALYEQKPGLAAPPGHSNHELGLAADLGYPTPGAEDAAHRAAGGCELEFPLSHEPWHVEPAGLA